MRYLLDTNVLGELRKRSGRPEVKEWVQAHRPEDMAISVVTVIEIETGILQRGRRDREQAHHLQRWLDEVVLPGFRDRILPVDLPVAHRVAALHVPDRSPQHDALIAGTALAHDLTLATRNVRDFTGTGVRILDPWTA